MLEEIVGGADAFEALLVRRDEERAAAQAGLFVLGIDVENSSLTAAELAGEAVVAAAADEADEDADEDAVDADTAEADEVALEELVARAATLSEASDEKTRGDSGCSPTSVMGPLGGGGAGGLTMLHAPPPTAGPRG